MRQHFLAGAVVPVMAMALAFPSPLTPAQAGVVAQVALGSARPAILQAGGAKRPLPQISNALLLSGQQILGVRAVTRAPLSALASNLPPFLSYGCSNRNVANSIPMNVRVNQDCTYQSQAGEAIAFDPLNSLDLIAGQNDSRIGFNHCGFDYSLNGGARWGDGILPFWNHLNDPTAPHTNTISGGAGTNHTYDLATDPAVTYDAAGDAYVSCAMHDVEDNASAIFVAMSPASAAGTYYNPIPQTGNAGVVVEDNSPTAIHDQPSIRADTFSSSGFQGSIYAVWTVFNDGCSNGYCESPIYFSVSYDRAQTWSQPIPISGINQNLCFLGNKFDSRQNQHACNFDQGADLQVQPNGTVVVVFNNCNTPANTPNCQQLAVVSTNGGASFSAPTKVGNDIKTNEPTCQFGQGTQECVPGSFVRVNDFPRLAVDRSNGMLYAAWNDYRSGQYGVVLSQSSDGKVWQEATTQVISDATDDYQAAIDVSPTSHAITTGFYQTARIPNENSGTPFKPPVAGVQAENTDYALAFGHSISVPFSIQRLSPTFPPPDGSQTGFMGDYSGLTVIGNAAHAIWADTRNLVPSQQGQPVTHDEDIFTQTASVQ